jgi:hypothetical protein
VLKLEKLEIERGASWAVDAGRLSGKVKFVDDEARSIELPLDEQLAHEIVSLCSDAMVRVTKAVANDLTAEIIQASAAPVVEIEDQTEEQSSA